MGRVPWSPETFLGFLGYVLDHASLAGILRQNPVEVLRHTLILGWLSLAGSVTALTALAILRKPNVWSSIGAIAAVGLAIGERYFGYVQVRNLINFSITSLSAENLQRLESGCSGALWIPLWALVAFGAVFVVTLVSVVRQALRRTSDAADGADAA